MVDAPFFHPESGTVRFWVVVDGEAIRASIGKETLHYRYKSQQTDDDPLLTYTQHASEIEAAVRRRLAAGSREPVMLRDFDLKVLAD